MKKINFLSVEAINFKNYKDKIDFKFENGKLNLITGPNGIGKTTIFDILPFTLYGITPSGLRSDDVVNNEIKKNCKTCCDFTIGEDYYKVERYVKDSKYGDTVLIFKNKDTKPYKKGQREIIPEIESLIVPQKLFMNTMLFGQKVKDFFTDLTDSDQKDIFRKVLQLDDYLLFYDESTNRLKRIADDILKNNESLSLSNKMMNEFADQINQIRDEIKKYNLNKNQKINDTNKLIEEDLKKISLLKENLTKIPENIDELIINAKSLKLGKESEYNNKAEKIQNEINSIKEKANAKKAEFLLKAAEVKNQLSSNKENEFKKIHDKEKEYIELTSKLNNKERESEKVFLIVDETTRSINDLTKSIEQIKNHLYAKKPICFTCKQPIEINQVKDLEIGLNEKIENLNKLNINLVNNEKLLNTIRNEKNDLSLKCKELSNEINSMKNLIEDTYKNLIKDIDNKLKESNEKVDAILNESIQKSNEKSKLENDLILKDINKLNGEIENYYKVKKLKEDILSSLNDIDKRISTYESILKNIENENYDDSLLENISNKFFACKTHIGVLEANGKSLNKEKEITEFWKVAFSSSGIPSILIDEAIPEMNRQIKYYLDEMGGRYVVSFDTQSETKSGAIKDKISVNLLDTITKSNKRKAFSGGQIRVIDIAVLLTLSDIQNMVQNMSSNLILLDEVFDSLDEENVSYVSALLRKICRDKSINIISHTIVDQVEADQIFRLG